MKAAKFLSKIIFGIVLSFGLIIYSFIAYTAVKAYFARQTEVKAEVYPFNLPYEKRLVRVTTKWVKPAWF